MSAGTASPLSSSTAFSVKPAHFLPRYSPMPAARMRLCTRWAMSPSSGAITWSAPSITDTAMPRSARFSAISRPMKPAPITAAVRGLAAAMWS